MCLCMCATIGMDGIAVDGTLMYRYGRLREWSTEVIDGPIYRSTTARRGDTAGGP